jgi:hypothetical protein
LKQETVEDRKESGRSSRRSNYERDVLEEYRRDNNDDATSKEA